MSDIALEFRGAKFHPDGSTAHHLAIIWEPEMDMATRNWCCTVGCYSLVPDAEKIIGTSAGQALRLARLFALDLMERHGVVIYPADREQ